MTDKKATLYTIEVTTIKSGHRQDYLHSIIVEGLSFDDAHDLVRLILPSLKAGDSVNVHPKGKG